GIANISLWIGVIVKKDFIRATATAVYTQSLGGNWFRLFTGFAISSHLEREKKIIEGDKAILVSTVKKINQRVLVGERGYSKGSRRYRSDTEQRKGIDTPGFVNLLNNQTSYNLDSPEPYKVSVTGRVKEVTECYVA
ncbi:LOW QUALITY PROTEIN: hypothetical protein HID58_086237, partial [Brassica napus]